MTRTDDPIFANAGANREGWAQRAVAWLRQAFSAGAHLMFGVLLVIAAAIVAVATAIVGLLLAAAALVARLVRPAGFQPRPVPVRAVSRPVVLNARRTSRGWRVE
jgi:UPF0716 family protein affecting phage T7 exclusion